MRRLVARAARLGVVVTAAVAGVAVAVAVGAAVAKSFTLHVKAHAAVINQSGVVKHENIVVTARGSVVYELSGDRAGHSKCTKLNGCFGFWPPVTVSSSHGLSKASGVKGKLGVFRRNGFLQLTLGGHPLYRYAGDVRGGRATGQGIRSFGGTWHVVGAPGSGGATGTTTTTTTTTTTSTPAPCLYPPCY